MAGGYPGDLRGYGRTPPHPHWPGDARIAVQFVVNFEEGGENDILHGDLASEAFLSDVLGAQPWPGQRHANIESMFEYGSRSGFWRLWRIFSQRNLPVTVFGVATALKRNAEVVAGRAAALTRFLDYIVSREGCGSRPACKSPGTGTPICHILRPTRGRSASISVRR